ncbi:hypothetical protein Pst134EA_013614 [Puccinia striiformis f. sp. tritici]|uniref:hypothetical protein n=1 Tax=Puccinia striiformis f. sp. tritici TaxID=168172 RepID=UPI002008A433|nr:hypothetical protein Pst134EA_013614 [Puccinia striiformis f. sp. tritici]KAH9465745.1 hypothetical protein Pst134EA_013614 [Puccinia striiformis f. sp. tritici]
MRIEDSKLEASPTTLEELKLCLPRAPDELILVSLAEEDFPDELFLIHFKLARKTPRAGKEQDVQPLPPRCNRKIEKQACTRETGSRRNP